PPTAGQIPPTIRPLPADTLPYAYIRSRELRHGTWTKRVDCESRIVGSPDLTNSAEVRNPIGQTVDRLSPIGSPAQLRRHSTIRAGFGQQPPCRTACTQLKKISI
ncbi:hypothetical protein PTTG_30834, partial [Puccinia triticina 1-1 BBBD Race 1]